MRILSIVVAVAALAVQPAGRDVHLTLHEGTSMAASMSPDGRTIAIDLLGTIWTLPAAGGRAKAVTDIAMDARQPSWSPDGRKIAFQAYRTSTWQIWTMNADGSELRAVTDDAGDAREPAWSPDGKRIAFSSDRMSRSGYDIWTIDVASGALTQVTSAPSNEDTPVWRSDADIAFRSDRTGAPGFYSRSLASPSEDHLIAPAGDRTVGGAAIAADGTIAFTALKSAHTQLMVGDRNLADEDEDVFLFRPQWIGTDVVYTADGKIKRRSAEGGTARVIEFSADVSFTRPAFTPKPHRLNPPGPQPVRGIMHPVISPDGQQIAFAALGDLWVMPFSGAPRKLTDDAAVETDPAWSPDGKSLAYSSDRSGSMQIWIRDLRAGSDRQLTGPVRGEAVPALSIAAPMQAAWSPEGARIAFTDADGQLFVVDVMSGAVRRVHDRLNEPGRPSWSPDGDAVIVSALKPYTTRFREGVNLVLWIPVDGGRPLNAAGGRDVRWFDPMPGKSIGMREDYGPIWSPDGSQMAAVVDGLLTAWPVARDGAPLGPPRPLSTELAFSPSWTKDSKQILYQSDNGLKLVDVATRRIVRTIDPKLTWTAPQAPPTTTTIHAGRFWNGRTDTAQTDVDIVVDGNRVKSVGPHRAELHGAHVVDASGQTVIPGLIEIHSHLSKSYGEALGRIWLSWGITTVRNPASNTFEAMEDREAFESGRRLGPRVFTTGEPLDGTRIYYPGGASIGEGGAQIREQLQHAQDFGYDFVKTYVRLPDLLQKQVIERAHAQGLPVTSHELYPAVAFGADGVEHIRGTSRRGYSPKITALSRSYRDVIDLLTASKMTLTPTIGIQGGFRLQTLRDASWIDDARIRSLYPATVWQRWRDQTRTAASAAVIEEAERLVKPQEKTVYDVVKGGGRVVAGTDSPINPYGLALLMELENYADGGLTPIEVLKTATSVSAEAIGVGAEIGSIEPGKLADISIVDGNPLVNIRDLRNVKWVMKNGTTYKVDNLLRRSP